MHNSVVVLTLVFCGDLAIIRTFSLGSEMAITIDTDLHFKKRHYKLAEFLEEVQTKLDMGEDKVFGRLMQDAEEDETIDTDTFLSRLDKLCK